MVNHRITSGNIKYINMEWIFWLMALPASPRQAISHSPGWNVPSLFPVQLMRALSQTHSIQSWELKAANLRSNYHNRNRKRRHWLLANPPNFCIPGTNLLAVPDCACSQAETSRTTERCEEQFHKMPNMQQNPGDKWTSTSHRDNVPQHLNSIQR